MKNNVKTLILILSVTLALALGACSVQNEKADLTSSSNTEARTNFSADTRQSASQGSETVTLITQLNSTTRPLREATLISALICVPGTCCIPAIWEIK